MNSIATLRTKSISTKVAEEEHANFEALAGELTISDWARDFSEMAVTVSNVFGGSAETWLTQHAHYDLAHPGAKFQWIS